MDRVSFVAVYLHCKLQHSLIALRAAVNLRVHVVKSMVRPVVVDMDFEVRQLRRLHQIDLILLLLILVVVILRYCQFPVTYY